MQLTPARHSHTFAIAKDLRPIDAEEARLMGHLTNLDAVSQALVHSGPLARTALRDGRPVAMAGAVPLDEQCASVWMLSTALDREAKRFLLRQARGFITALHYLYPTLIVALKPDNRESIRFLKWLGFDFPAQAPFEVPLGLTTMVKSLV